MSRSKSQFFALLVAAILAATGATACGEGDADLCYTPEGVPNFVERAPSTVSRPNAFGGCDVGTEAAPNDPDTALCDDACVVVAECQLLEFDTCLAACEPNPGCAAGFRCLRDTACDEQVELCTDLLDGCATEATNSLR